MRASWDAQCAGRTESNPAGGRLRAILKLHSKPGGYSARPRRRRRPVKPDNMARIRHWHWQHRSASEGRAERRRRRRCGRRPRHKRRCGRRPQRRPQHRCERADAHGSPQSGNNSRVVSGAAAEGRRPQHYWEPADVRDVERAARENPMNEEGSAARTIFFLKLVTLEAGKHRRDRF